VSAFLQGKLRFLDIPALVEEGLAMLPVTAATSLDVLRDADREARSAGERLLSPHPSRATPHA
ncbi:MAG: 1-deoxy-D-xylulose-5-phosphate reductoisomerase, partial [Proteobacteria bacterium]|nr:1-deoxy-D-xylulose-5-phosphate reductoisomerase [Pseudomonadota bacterium]